MSRRTPLMENNRPMDKRQCTAKSKQSGQRCKRAPIPGGFVCVMHGGGTPNAKEAARVRLLAMVDGALGVLARATRTRRSKNWEPSPTEISAAKEILARAGVGESGSDQPQGATINLVVKSAKEKPE